MKRHVPVLGKIEPADVEPADVETDRTANADSIQKPATVRCARSSSPREPPVIAIRLQVNCKLGPTRLSVCREESGNVRKIPFSRKI